MSAGATAVLAKEGVEEVPTNLATAIRMVIAASALGTGTSWLCHFQALSMGPVSKGAPVDKLSFVVAMVLGVLFLGETVGPMPIAASGCR